MDFLTWWFETHYIASTLLTPFCTWIWLLYTDGNFWHEFVAIVVWLLYGGLNFKK